jgi:hypothetical protein
VARILAAIGRSGLLLLLACEREAAAVPALGDDPGDEGAPLTECGIDALPGEDSKVAPTAPVLDLLPRPATAAGPLVASLVEPGVDPGGEVVTHRYWWFLDGTPVEDQLRSSVAADLLREGQEWRVCAAAKNREHEGPPGTAVAVIENAAPSTPRIRVEPAAPEPAETLVLVVDAPAVDADGDEVAVEIAWFVDQAERLEWAGAVEIPAGVTADAETWTVRYSSHDGGHEATVVEASVAVGNVPPEIRSFAISPSRPTEADTLVTAIETYDADGDSLTITYRWTRDGVEQADLGNVSSVDRRLTAAGETWQCEVEVSDGQAVRRATTEAVTTEATSIGVYRLRFTGAMTPDGDEWSTFTGRAEGEAWKRAADGGIEYQCAEAWDLDARAEEPCRSCDFEFTGTATRDVGASGSSPPGSCSELQVNGEFRLHDYDAGTQVYTWAYVFGPTWGEASALGWFTRRYVGIAYYPAYAYESGDDWLYTSYLRAPGEVGPDGYFVAEAYFYGWAL